MAKLSRLTKKQIELMNNVRDEYINYFNSLEFDEDKCKKFINKLYEISRLKEPIIIFLNSPLGLQYGCNIIKNTKLKSIQVWNQVKNQVKNQVRNQVENQVWNQVDNQVRNQVGNQVWNQVDNQVRNQVENQVWNQVKNQVRNQVGNQVWNQVDNQVRNQVDNQVRNQVKNQVWNQVKNQVWNQRLEYFDESYHGRCDDSIWISTYDYFERIDIHHHELFLQIKELFKCGIFTSIQLKKVCFVSRPPIFLKRDDRNNMHCIDDYAIYFKDGFGLHYVYGVYFSDEDFKKYIKGKKAKAEDILKLSNAEQKASLIRLYGYEYLLNQLPELKLIDEEEVLAIDGKKKKHRLYSFKLENREFKIMALDDHSTNKQYFLGVPPEINKINEALKWSFQLEKDDYYKPILQS